MAPPPVVDPKARVLLMYITMHSGHYRASQALERAIRRLAPTAVVRTMDAFGCFNPLLSQIVDRTYMSVIRTAPEIWDYLYDNPKVAQRAKAFRAVLHRYDSPKLKVLLEEFRPTAIACTQAFPCGIAADYKQQAGLTIPLYGVLTDFIPHNYWLHEQVDGYMVGSDDARRWLERSGVPCSRIHHTGIPIDPVFAEPLDGAGVRESLGLTTEEPVVLVMGGGQGLGPIEPVVKALDALPGPLQLVVVTGLNARLQKRLTNLVPTLRRRVVVLGHVPYVHELMALATLLVTKPGGMTTSEALAARLPLVVVDPIPGQEAKNTQYLLARGAARQAPAWGDVPPLVQELLDHPEPLAALRRAAAALGRPRSALEIAQRLLQR